MPDSFYIPKKKKFLLFSSAIVLDFKGIGVTKLILTIYANFTSLHIFTFSFPFLDYYMNSIFNQMLYNTSNPFLSLTLSLSLYINNADPLYIPYRSFNFDIYSSYIYKIWFWQEGGSLMDMTPHGRYWVRVILRYWVRVILEKSMGTYISYWQWGIKNKIK